MSIAWWVSLGLLALAIVALLLQLPGAAIISPWLFVIGLLGLITQVVIRVVRRATKSRQDQA